VSSLQFTVAVISYLGAHELGHYVARAATRVSASLRTSSASRCWASERSARSSACGPNPHRNALVDIGASGPLAGFLVSFPSSPGG
jgi:hypothetical protein